MIGKEEAIKLLESEKNRFSHKFQPYDIESKKKWGEAFDMAIDAIEGIEKVVDSLRSAVNIQMALESSLEIEKHNKNVMIKRIITDINDLKALSSTTIMNNRDLIDLVLEIIDKRSMESEK